MNNPACNRIMQHEQVSRPRPVRQCLLAALLLLFWVNPGWSKAPACPAYEQLRPLLNSERIESCFGSYGVEVLEQQGNLRISSLYSLAGSTPAPSRERGSLPHVGGSEAADTPADSRITRTLAISEFATDLPKTLQAPYQAIRDGASMGATLEAAGWRVDKRHRYLGEVPIRTTSGCISDLPTETTQPWAAQVYDLWVLHDGKEVRFALLAELHDPRYLTLQDLQRIYPAMINEPQPVDPAFERLLQQARRVCAANE